MINAGDYGFPQRRKRVFIFAYRKGSKIYKKLEKDTHEKIVFQSGVIAKAFPCELKDKLKQSELFSREIIDDREKYMKKYTEGRFKHAGAMINGRVVDYEIKARDDFEISPSIKSSLQDILQPLKDVDNEFIIKDKKILKQWEEHKIRHGVDRKAKDGTKYKWQVGTMDFPDCKEKPSRTILTSEGTKSPSRTSHIIEQSKTFRRLTPIELERLNMFPDNFTKIKNIPTSKRGFMMGNALVVGVVEVLGNVISSYILD